MRNQARLTFPLLLAGLCAVLFLLPADLAARQASVEGVVQENDGRPVSGVLVSLEDARGSVVGRTLSDGNGRFTLRAPEPGSYRLFAERIGFRPTPTTRFEVVAGDTVRQDIRLTPEPIRLEGIAVEGEGSRCVLSPDEGSAIADVWGQARQVFARVAATQAEDAFRFDLRRYERLVEIPTAEIVSERWRSSRGSVVPFRSAPIEEMLEGGWVRSPQPSVWEYMGPDAEVLLSDAFGRAHCFALRSDPDRPDLLGVAFEPLERSRAPAIYGVLWMDRRTGELRDLRFHYTRHPHADEMPDPLLELFGGEMEFRALPDGRWVVDRWTLRMPAWSDGAEGRSGSTRPHPTLGERLDEIRRVVGEVRSWWWRNQIEQGLLVFLEEGGEVAGIERTEWPD